MVAGFRDFFATSAGASAAFIGRRHPLYRFLSDKKAGDVTGQGLNAFGAPWCVVPPSGAQVSGRS